MGLADSIKNAGDGNLADKAKETANNNDERVDAGVDRAGDVVDDKTGGKLEGQVDKGQDALKDKTGNL